MENIDLKIYNKIVSQVYKHPKNSIFICYSYHNYVYLPVQKRLYNNVNLVIHTIKNHIKENITYQENLIY